MIYDLTFSISPTKSSVKVDITNFSDLWINLTINVNRETQITCFTVKTFNILGIEGNFLSQIKGIYKKPRANIIVKV